MSSICQAGTVKEGSPDGAFLSINGLQVLENNQMLILTVSGGPALELTDARGFKSAFGVTRLTTTRTGADEKTSAASLVMFDEQGKVIWKQP